MWVVILLITFLALVCIKLYLKYERIYKLSKQFSGPPSLPIIGHGHHFLTASSEHLAKILFRFYVKYGSHRNTLKLWIGPKLVLFLNDLQDIEKILSGHDDNFNTKAADYKFLKPWLNDGLLLSEGEKWRKRRKVITPAFHFNILETFVECFDRQSKILVQNLSKFQSNQKIELYESLSRCTLDIIGESGMGVKINSQNNENSSYFEAVNILTHNPAERMTNIFYRYEFLYQFTKLARIQKKALKVAHGFTENIIKTRHEELLKTSADDARPQKTFLDILLHSQIDGKSLTDLEIREEVDTFLFEGHDTTAAGLIFFFYNIGKHPEEQQKCYEEIISVVGADKDSSITYEHLTKLRYTEMCIKETLRFFPPVPVLGREVINECELNGRTFPAGIEICLSIHYLGRNADVYPDPYRFWPERFETVNSSEKMNPFSYIPFSAGPRNCIGQKHAMLELKTVIVNVLRNFEIKYCGDWSEAEPLLAPHIVLRSIDPLMFKLKPRATTLSK